jgi:hypothetical protein
LIKEKTAVRWGPSVILCVGCRWLLIGRSGRRRTVALLPSIKGLCLDPAGLKRCRRLCPVGTHRRDAVLLRCRPPRLTPLLRSWVHVAEDDRAATPDRASRRRSPVLDEEAAATPPFLLAGEPLPALSCPPFTASAHPPLFTCAARRNPRRPGVRRRRTKPTSSSTSAPAPHAALAGVGRTPPCRGPLPQVPTWAACLCEQAAPVLFLWAAAWDTARWPSAVFLFSEFIQIQANFKNLYRFGLNSGKYETNFLDYILIFTRV